MPENKPSVEVKQCTCVDELQCHFCTVPLDPGEFTSDELAWADYAIPLTDGGWLHILAHGWCADGQQGVERA
jgi:hypothetical protein